MLEKIDGEEDLTVEYFKEILDAVHVEGASSNTFYSNIFDLKNGGIYIYYFHQFDEVVKLNVAEEIAKNSEPTPIKNLFSEGILENATDEYEKYRNQEITKNALFVIILIAIIGFVFFALRKTKK
jgi:hypothetical protein